MQNDVGINHTESPLIDHPNAWYHMRVYHEAEREDNVEVDDQRDEDGNNDSET
jgi:hypothetical protein